MRGLILFFLIYQAIGAQVLAFNATDIIPTQEEVLESERDLFFRGGHNLEIGEYDLAISTYKKIISSFPSSPALDVAFYKLSEIYAVQNRYDEAITYLEMLVRDYPASDIIHEARYKLAMLYYKARRYADAIPLLDGIAKTKAKSEYGDKLELYSRLADIYSSPSFIQERLVDAVSAHLSKKSLIKDTLLASEIDSDIQGLIDKADAQGLIEIVNAYPRMFPGDYALIRLTRFYEEKKDYFQERRNLKHFLANFRTHPFRTEAMEMMERIELGLKGKHFLVGVAVHLSDDFAVFGQNILDGVHLAYEDVSDRPDYIGLLIKDFTKENFFVPLNEMTKKYRPLVIIGPMLSAEVAKASSIIRRAGIPILSPAASKGRVDVVNDYFFRVSMTDVMMMRRLVDYSVNDLGITRFATFRPSEGYYRNLAMIFRNEVTRLGGRVMLEHAYTASLNDYSTLIKDFIKADLKLEGEMVNLEEPAADEEKPQESTSDKKKKEQLELVPGYDALFVPGEAGNVGRLLPQLAFFGINNENVQMLGDNAWHSPVLQKNGKKFVKNGIFVDGFFTDSKKDKTREFVRKFKAKYSRMPDIYAAQGYDAMQLIIKGLDNGVTSRDEMREYLAGIVDYEGATGRFSLSDSGFVEKDLFLIKVGRRKFIEVEQKEPVKDVETLTEPAHALQ